MNKVRADLPGYPDIIRAAYNRKEALLRERNAGSSIDSRITHLVRQKAITEALYACKEAARYVLAAGLDETDPDVLAHLVETDIMAYVPTSEETDA